MEKQNKRVLRKTKKVRGGNGDNDIPTPMTLHTRAMVEAQYERLKKDANARKKCNNNKIKNNNNIIQQLPKK